MAARIGVARRWWQSPARCSGSHYDIALSKRTLAVRAGAIEITWRQAGAMSRQRIVTGVLGAPSTAQAWVQSYRAQRRGELAPLVVVTPDPSGAQMSLAL